MRMVVYSLLAGSALFQAALALGAPWGRCAYGGRVATVAGALPLRLRIASAGTVLVLGVAAYVAHSGPAWAAWAFAALFGANTLGNLAGRHPVERWLMSASTLVLAFSFARGALG